MIAIRLSFSLSWCIKARKRNKTTKRNRVSTRRGANRRRSVLENVVRYILLNKTQSSETSSLMHLWNVLSVISRISTFTKACGTCVKMYGKNCGASSRLISSRRDASISTVDSFLRLQREETINYVGLKNKMQSPISLRCTFVSHSPCYRISSFS